MKLRISWQVYPIRALLHRWELRHNYVVDKAILPLLSNLSFLRYAIPTHHLFSWLVLTPYQASFADYTRFRRFIFFTTMTMSKRVPSCSGNSCFWGEESRWTAHHRGEIETRLKFLKKKKERRNWELNLMEIHLLFFDRVKLAFRMNFSSERKIGENVGGENYYRIDFRIFATTFRWNSLIEYFPFVSERRFSD